MATTSASLSYALDEVVSVLVYESFYSEPFLMPSLYGVRTSMKRRERTASLAGLTEWSAKTPNVAPAEDSIIQQFEKDFNHTPYGKQVPIERELIDDQEWGLLEDIGTQIGVSASYSMEKKAAAPFVDAFVGGTYTAEDSLSICNGAHLNVDGGNSQSNSGTNALGMAGVTTSRIAMRRFSNYRGDMLSVIPDTLLVPTDLEETAYEIVRSTDRPDTANRSVNMYNGMFSLYVWPLLTDTNAWFLIDSRLMKMNLLWYQRVGLEVFGEGNLLTGTRKVGGYYRCSNGVRDWRWVYGNNPS